MPPRYECSFCGERFSRHERMERHVSSVHTGDRPYKCDDCSAAFVRKDHLKRHSFIHTGERKWRCTADGCTHAFYEQSHWKRHIETHAPKAESVQAQEAASESSRSNTPLPSPSTQSMLGPTSSKRPRQEASGSHAPLQKRSRTTATAADGLSTSSSMPALHPIPGQLMRLPPSKMAYVLASADPFATLPESVTEAFGLGASSPMSIYRRMSSDDGSSTMVSTDNAQTWVGSGPAASPPLDTRPVPGNTGGYTAPFQVMPRLHAFPIAPSLHPTISSASLPSSLEDEGEDEDTGSDEEEDLNTTNNSMTSSAGVPCVPQSAVHKHGYVFVPSSAPVKGEGAQSMVRMVPIPPSKLRGIPGLAQVLLHQCPYNQCSRTFKQKRDLRAHVRYDHEHDFLTCPHCDKTFKRPKFWERHVIACETAALQSTEAGRKEASSGGAPMHQPPQDVPMSDFLLSALNVDPADIARDLNAGRSAFLLSPEFLSLPEPAVPGLATRRRASFEIPTGSVSAAGGSVKSLVGGTGMSGDVAI